MNRIDIVRNALGVGVDDTEKVTAHPETHKPVNWCMDLESHKDILSKLPTCDIKRTRGHGFCVCR